MSGDLAEAAKSAYFVRKTNASQTSGAKTSSAASVLSIPGTKTSLQNSQLLTPIGIPSIDSFIGGGLPVGGVCLIGQDTLNTYSETVTRCFIAEGVSHKHSIYLADLVEEKDKYFQVEIKMKSIAQMLLLLRRCSISLKKKRKNFG